MALTARQQRFIEEYLIDLNATQAAIRAGYSEKTANEQASQNLAKLNIQEAITELKQQRSIATGITAESVLREIDDLLKLCMREVVTEQGSRIENPATAAKCLEMKAKHIGLFEKDNRQQSVNLVTSIEIS